MNLRGPQRGQYFNQLRSFELLKKESPSLSYSIIDRTVDFGFIIKRCGKQFMGLAKGILIKLQQELFNVRRVTKIYFGADRIPSVCLELGLYEVCNYFRFI